MEKLFNQHFLQQLAMELKNKQAKGPLEHVKDYAEKINPERKKEPCLDFLKKLIQKFVQL